MPVTNPHTPPASIASNKQNVGLNPANNVIANTAPPVAKLPSTVKSDTFKIL